MQKAYWKRWIRNPIEVRSKNTELSRELMEILKLTTYLEAWPGQHGEAGRLPPIYGRDGAVGKRRYMGLVEAAEIGAGGGLVDAEAELADAGVDIVEDVGLKALKSCPGCDSGEEI